MSQSSPSAFAPLGGPVGVAHGHTHDRDGRVYAADRHDARYAAAVRTMTLPPISSRRIRFGEPTSSRPSGSRSRPSGRARAPGSPQPPRRRLVTARAAAREREVVAREFKLHPDHLGSEDPEGFLEQLLAGLVALEATIVVSPCIGGQSDRMGWTRKGRKGAFTYFDQHGRQIRDPAKIERIERLADPTGVKDVSISTSARAKLQATGYDKAGRKQYLYRRGLPGGPGAGQVRQAHPVRRVPADPASDDGGASRQGRSRSRNGSPRSRCA